MITRRELITEARKGTGVCRGRARQKEERGEMWRQEAAQGVLGKTVQCGRWWGREGGERTGLVQEP